MEARNPLIRNEVHTMPNWIFYLPMFGRTTSHAGTYHYDRRDMVMGRQV